MPAAPPRSVALQSTVAGGAAGSVGTDGTDLGATPGTDDDASFLRDVLDVEAPPRLRPGQLVDGAYRIERKLGQGGMGVVFLARDVRLDRQVALKIHRVARRQAGLERLVREARAMAQLVHPNVVTVYDVGTVERDVYVAMEFLDGGTVRQWQATPRPWREVVALFIQAGRGLAAAHQAGFVHRDFKPDNILLGADGRVRVADFGLVRLLGDSDGGATSSELRAPRGRQRTAVTERGWRADRSGRAGPADETVALAPGAAPARPAPIRPAPADEAPDPDDVLSPRRDSATATGTVMGTPAYMAPEQHAAGDVGAAADQFAFCVSLWEALHGERPFAGETLGELAAAVGAQRLRPPPRDRVVPAHVRRVLARGLALEPSARFPSMAALLAALARDPARSRRRAVTAVAGAVALVAIGVGALSLVRERAAGAGDACAGAAAAMAPTWPADRPAAIEHAFTATGRPYAGHAADRVRDVFDRFAARWSAARVATCRAEQNHQAASAVRRVRDRCLDRARAQFAALVDAFAHADAKVVDLSLAASARLPDLAQCDDVETLQHSPLAGAAALPPAVVRLTQQFVAARTAFDTGRFPEAQAILAPEIAALGDGDGGDPAIAAAVFLLHGSIANAVNEMAQSRASFERAARLAAIARDDRMVAAAWISLMEILEKLGKADEAEGLRAVTEAALERSGNPPRLRASFLSGVGRMRSSAGRFAEAHAALAEAGAILEADPDGGREELTGVLNRLGILAKREGKPAEARARFEQSIAMQVELRGRDHPYTLASISNLASVISEAGDRAAALALQEEVLAARTRIFGARDPSNFSSHTNLGVTLQSLGRYDDALPHFAIAAELAATLPGARQRWTAQHNLGSLALDRGHPDDAIAALGRALEHGAESPGANNPELLETYVELADAHSARGDGAAALATVDRGRTTAGAKLADGHPRLARLEVARATALLAARGAGPARDVAAATVTALRAAGPLGGATALHALRSLGRAELALGHRAAARAALAEARALAAATLGVPHPEVADLDALLAQAR